MPVREIFLNRYGFLIPGTVLQPSSLILQPIKTTLIECGCLCVLQGTTGEPHTIHLITFTSIPKPAFQNYHHSKISRWPKSVDDIRTKIFSNVIALSSFDTSRTRAGGFVADAQRTASISQASRMLSEAYFFSACTRPALLDASNQQVLFIEIPSVIIQRLILGPHNSCEDRFRRWLPNQASCSCRRYVESVSCNPCIKRTELC